MVTSARATDSTILQKLYNFNSTFSWEIPVAVNSLKKRKADYLEDWGGFTVRSMLQLLYIISTLCLLRYEEALGITWENIYLESWMKTFWLQLDLQVRKTYQNGSL